MLCMGGGVVGGVLHAVYGWWCGWWCIACCVRVVVWLVVYCMLCMGGGVVGGVLHAVYGWWCGWCTYMYMHIQVYGTPVSRIFVCISVCISGVYAHAKLNNVDALHPKRTHTYMYMYTILLAYRVICFQRFHYRIYQYIHIAVYSSTYTPHIAVYSSTYTPHI